MTSTFDAALRAALDFLAVDHALGFVVGAAAVCLLSAQVGFRALLVWRDGARAVRPIWLVLGMGAFGLGVWSTHFIAMLGWRPDLLLAFRPTETLASLAIAAALIGPALFVAAQARSLRADALGGAGAGTAVAAMHAMGVAGATGCALGADPGVSALAAALGAVCFAGALAALRRLRRHGGLAAAGLFTLGVAGLHFVSVAGLSVAPAAAPGPNDLARDQLAPVMLLVAGALLATLFGLLALQGWRDAERQRLAAVALNLPMGAVILTAEGEIESVNPSLLARSGLICADLRGRRPTDALLDAAADPAGALRLRDAVEAGRAVGCDVAVRTAEGGSYVAEAALSPAADPSGRVLGFVLLLTDVAEPRAREAELASARDRAERASVAKSEFISVMSHELRTPLNGVLGFVALLAPGEEDPARRRRIEAIGDSARALLTVLTDILEFTAEGAEPIRLAPTSVHELAHAAVARARPRASARGLALQAQVAPRTPERLMLDAPRLGAAIDRLLDNALKFTDHGAVAVTVRADRGRDRAPTVVIEVRDTGAGVAADALPTLFDAFAQGDGSATRRFGGVGLGLTLVRREVERMGGAITVDSAAGVGSVFRIALPLREAPATLVPDREDLALSA